MGIQHLNGKRTGRPPGSKSTPPWIRDARWAYQNLGDSEAVPPSPLAAHLLALGREHPDRLATCLSAIDAHQRGLRPDLPDSAAAPTTESVVPKTKRPYEGKSLRLKLLDIQESKLLDLFREGDGEIAFDIPDNAKVCGTMMFIKSGIVRLFLRSTSFQKLKKGDLIPRV